MYKFAHTMRPRQRRLSEHAPHIAARLVEMAERLEARGEPLDVLDGLALRNIAAIVRTGGR